MSALHRIVMVRHGETEGESSIRFHGSTDVPLSEAGRAQLRRSARLIGRQEFHLIVSSSLRRSWEGAEIVSGNAPVRMEPNFNEIDFGRWEGLTTEEIRAKDPVLYEDWQSKRGDFDFPGGETRAAFGARVARGLENLNASGAGCVLLVCHKGVIRTIVEILTANPYTEDIGLGAVIAVSCGPGEVWSVR